jgi:hypothetical protein
MKLHQYKLAFIATGLIGILLIITPSLSMWWPTYQGENYSDLYLLNSQQAMGNYPFNIATSQNYTLYVGVSNHLSSSACYVLYVKFGDLSQVPVGTLGSKTSSHSSLPPLFEYQFSIQNSNSCVLPLSFSIVNDSFSPLLNESTVNTIAINGVLFNVNKEVSLNSLQKLPSLLPTNQTISGYYYQLIVERWIYNVRTNSIVYDNDYVNLALNLTINRT